MPKKSKAFFITVLILSFALTLTLADLFSSFLNIGNFAFLPSQGIKTSAYKIYAISLYKSSTHAEASSHVKEVKTKSGAGFVYQTNGIYYVLASGYENENDALSVQNNLKESKTESEILELSIGQIQLDMTLDGTEKNALLEMLNGFKTAFKSLYDISISLDTGVKGLIDSKVELNNLRDKITKTKQEFDTAFKNKLSSQIYTTKLKALELTTIIQGVIELDYSDKVLLSSALKEAYLKIIIANKALASDLLT